VRRAVKALAALALGSVAALMLGEAFARLFLAPGPSIVLRYQPDNANYALTRDVSGELGYEFVPGSSLYRLSINQHGLRDLERSAEKPAGLRRILALGDSITIGGSWGEYVPLLQTWPLVLERITDDPAGQRIEVWNAGIVGYNLPQYAAFLEQRLLRFEPDAIVIGLCLNDMAVRQEIRREDDGFSVEWTGHYYPVALDLGPATNRWLLEHSELWRRINVSVAESTDETEAMIDLDFEAAEQALERIRAAAAGRGVPVLGLLFPGLDHAGVSTEASSTDHARLAGILRRSGFPVVDLSAAFGQYSGPRLRNHPDDAVHPNALGHCLAAREAHRALRRFRLRWYPDRDLPGNFCAPAELTARESSD